MQAGRSDHEALYRNRPNVVTRNGKLQMVTHAAGTGWAVAPSVSRDTSNSRTRRWANHGAPGAYFLLERALTADFAFVKAWKGDPYGNLVYRKTARNLNPVMATAAKVTIAEVEHLVDLGELDGDQIQTPSIYVKRICQGGVYEKVIERRMVRKVNT